MKESLRFFLRLPRPGGYILFRLRIFPQLALNTINEKKHNLPKEVFTFYNYLYLLALERLLPEEQILKMVDDEELRKNPEKLIKLTIDLKRKRDGKVPGFDEPEKQFRAPDVYQSSQSLLRRVQRRLIKMFLPKS